MNSVTTRLKVSNTGFLTGRLLAMIQCVGVIVEDVGIVWADAPSSYPLGAMCYVGISPA